MPTRTYLAAVDFSFILAVSAGHAECLNAFKALEERRFEFILTETPLQELQDIVEHPESTQEFRALAEVTIRSLRPKYGIKTPGLDSAYNGVAEEIATFLLANLSFSTSANSEPRDEALAIVEASLHECDFLITLDDAILEIDAAKLNMLLVQKDANPLQVLSPTKLVFS